MSIVLLHHAVANLARSGALPVGRLRFAADPLGPTGQQPDGPRDLACDLTAADSVCSPSTVAPLPDRTPDIGSASTAGPAIGNVLVLLLVLALVAAIVWMVVLVIRNRGAAADDDIEDLDEDLEDAVDERIIDETNPPDRWRRAAAEHRVAGRYRDAVRCEYRALVGDLARAGIVDEIPGRTSGEERVQLAELAPAVAPTFSEAADLFDEAWFDDDEVTASHDARFRAAERIVVDNVLGQGVRARTRRPVGGRQ